jgi:hypothetical protein
MALPSKYGDFSALDDLGRVLTSPMVQVVDGIYQRDQPEPGPHLILSAPGTNLSFDIIRREDASFIVRVLS